MNVRNTSRDYLTDKVVDVALIVGKIMLRNGAETYRVEDTMTRICESKHLFLTQVFVVPTGIFLTVRDGEEVYTRIERIKSSGMNLAVIDQINDFAWNYVNNRITPGEEFRTLKQISKAKVYSKKVTILFTGIASCFFTILLGGDIPSFIVSFFVGILTGVYIDKLSFMGMIFFLRNFIEGTLMGLTTILFSYIGGLFGYEISIDYVMIGCLMPLVPGVALTNAIRDSISGDLISGGSKLYEALLIALGIAAGVGVTLTVSNYLFGGVL